MPRSALIVLRCDAKMYHIMAKTSTIKRATVRDLRYRFPEIEARLNKGEEIEVCKRKKVIARLVPVRPKLEEYPDFAALQKKIFGKKKARTTGTQLVSWARGDN